MICPFTSTGWRVRIGMNDLILNRVHCRKCGDIITSYTIDSTEWCSCGAVALGNANHHQKQFYGGKYPDIAGGNNKIDEDLGRPILNRVRCRKCGDIIRSMYTHDFVNCKCDSIAIDGGNEYQRLTGELADMDLSWSVYENQKIDVARHLSNSEYRLLLQVHENFISRIEPVKREEYHLSKMIQVLRNLKEDCLEVRFSNNNYHYYKDGTCILW